MFPINSSSRGTPGSRDRLSPGPRWGLGLLRSSSREERFLPATSMQLSRAEGPGLPLPRRPPLPPPPLSGSPGRGSKHTPPRSGPAPLLQAHALPHRLAPPRGQQSWSLQPSASTPGHKRGDLEQGRFSMASPSTPGPPGEGGGRDGGGRGFAEAVTEGADPVHRNFRQQ